MVMSEVVVWLGERAGVEGGLFFLLFMFLFFFFLANPQGYFCLVLSPPFSPFVLLRASLLGHERTTLAKRQPPSIRESFAFFLFI